MIIYVIQTEGNLVATTSEKKADKLYYDTMIEFMEDDDWFDFVEAVEPVGDLTEERLGELYDWYVGEYLEAQEVNYYVLELDETL